MSELAVRTNTPNAIELPTDSSAAGLIGWAQAADAAYRFADMMCSTRFVPQQYRGKPHEGAAAILAGAEVGLSPMASLRAFDDIQGTPAPKAVTLRAIVQAQGHDIRIDESTERTASVSARRKGADAWQTSVWTIARAQQMGLLSKDQWKKQPGAMLVARATSEVCRWVASDAIMGMPYSAEEMMDGDAPFEPQVQARRVTAADIIDADTATQVTVERADAQAAEPEAARMGDGQRRKMFALFAAKGIDGADMQRDFVSKAIGRDVTSRGGLNEPEADKVIAALGELPDLPADVPGDAEPAGDGAA